MNLAIYKIISAELTEAIQKSYKAGIASVIKKNKEKLLFSDGERDLFKIDYTGVDHVALQNFKVEAFTVAGVMTYELEEKLKELATDLQEGKHPLAKGEKDINKVFIAESYNILADYIQVKDFPPPGYLQTNLRTAITSSYHAAQYIRLQDKAMLSIYPAYQYKTLEDNRVREEHAKLNNLIYYADDPIWDRIYPPLEWNCRCYIKPLDQDEVQSSGVEPYTDEDTREAIIKEANISKDFDRNPGQARSIWGKWLNTKLAGKNYENISYEIVKAGFSMPRWDYIEPLLKEAASEFPEQLEYSKENFEILFGKLPGKVDTVLGQYKFADIFFTKLSERDRENVFPYIKTTLQEPNFVFVDKENGTLFVKAFKSTKGEINYAGILKQLNDEEIVISFYDKKNLNNKVNEGKFLVYQSLIPASGNAWRLPKFTHDAGRVNFNNNLTFSFNLKNVVIPDTVDIEKKDLNDADEIWGETYDHKSVVNSEINIVKYRVEGFELIKINNNEVYDTKFYDYSKIDDFRKGVLLI